MVHLQIRRNPTPADEDLASEPEEGEAEEGASSDPPCNKSTVLVQGPRGDDKKKIRLIQYIISSTPHYRLVGTIGDAQEHLELRLYVDADVAGNRLTGISTSGGFLVLYGPNTFFPLAWVSKRQTST